MQVNFLTSSLMFLLKRIGRILLRNFRITTQRLIFLPMLLESPTPGVINIDSSAALMTLAGTSMYSASKAALKGFTEALRVEFQGKMYVSLVCPGFTKTDIFRDQGTESNSKGQKVMDMISTDCDLMVKMIMKGSKLFSAVMRMANVDIFKEVFND